MGHFGRVTKRSDLPSKAVLAGYVKKAAALNDEGVKVAARAQEGRAENGEGAGRSRRGAQEEREGAEPASTR